jgi:hypothetical protein
VANNNVEIITPVSVEPIALSDMKTMLRVTYTDEDAFISALITRGRKYAERITYRALAPQVLRATIEPDPMPEGMLSGPVGGDFDAYRLNERMTTVPFGFYGPLFALPYHPVSQITTVEYQLTPFDGQPAATMQWTGLASTDANGNLQWMLDTNTTPMTVILRPLLVANRFRFTYSAGYNNSTGYATGAVPDTIIDQIMAWVSFRFDHRQGEAIPEDIMYALAAERIYEL